MHSLEVVQCLQCVLADLVACNETDACRVQLPASPFQLVVGISETLQSQDQFVEQLAKSNTQTKMHLLISEIANTYQTKLNRETPCN